LRLRQLSTGRLYDRVKETRNLDVARLGQEGREPATRVRELPLGPLRLAVPGTPAGRGEMPQAGDELVLAEPCRLVQRAGCLPVLAPVQVTLRAPEDALEPGLRRRPFLLGTRVVVHADDRA
jgi:hypothetical protein